MAEHLKELKDRVSRCPYSQLLGVEVEEIAPGYARVAATVSPEHHNWIGHTHGGWIASVADQAFSISCNTVPGIYVAVQFSINFINNPASGERVWAEGRVVHQGKTLAVVEIKVTNSLGKSLATASGTAVALGERVTNNPPLPGGRGAAGG